MRQVFSGPAGSGKTTALKNKYIQLVNEGVKSDNILVLARSTADVALWRKELAVPLMGQLNISTYFGFVQSQLATFWPLIVGQLPGGHQHTLPVFMTVEASHYLMMELVEERLQQGGFRDVKATAENIAIQLIDNLNQAAVSGIQLAEASRRLRRLGAIGGSREKVAAYNDAAEIMQKFRDNCRHSHSIDYSLAIIMYTDCLCRDDHYLPMLDRKYRYVLVDDLQEIVPVAQDLIVYFLKGKAGVYLGYNPRGGHTDFFGAYPEGVEQNILPLCVINELENQGIPKKIQGFTEGLIGTIAGQAIADMSMAPLLGEFITDTRGALLEEVADEITRLVKEGTDPGEIAVISPLVDKVLEFDLSNRLSVRNIEVASVNRSKRLLDQPFAQAMVTLAVIVNHQWEMPLNYSAIVQCLSLLLEIDPIRSAVLAERVIRCGNRLPDPGEPGLLKRIGFRNGEKYRELYEWVGRRSGNEDFDLRLLFQQVFAELLAPLNPGEEDLLAVRQILDSAVKLHKALERYYGINAMDIDRCFIELVQKGTLAADMLYRPPVNKEKVILTTSLNFVLNPNIAPVNYQFWIDIGGRQWLQGIAKELANPWVLSRRWGEGHIWDDLIDQRIRMNKLTRLLRALLGKCKQGIFTAHSQLSSQGWEQDGILLEAFEVMKERGAEKND